MYGKLTSVFFIFFAAFLLTSCTKSEEVSDIAPYSWEVIRINTPDRLFPEWPDNSYVLEFATDGNYNLSLDVNNCWGQYAVLSDGEINLEYPGCTEICCDSDFAHELLDIISEVTEFYVLNKILTLQTGDGLTTIKLKRL